MVVLYVAAYLTVEAVRMYHRPKTQIDKLAAISGLIIVVDLSLRYASSYCRTASVRLSTLYIDN